MSIRRNVLIIICILSLSMILSSCDKRGSKIEEDNNYVVISEEDKPVEPSDIVLLNTRITEFGKESMFQAKYDNGAYIRMAFRSHDSTTINIGINVNGVTVRVVKLSASNQNEVVPYTIDKTSIFKLVYEPTDSNTMLLDVIVKQYENMP